MVLPLTYSRRKRAASEPKSEVFEYGAFSEKLRNQIAQVIVEAVGDYNRSSYAHRGANEVWDFVVRRMRRELGVSSLSGYAEANSQREIIGWMRTHDNVDEYLDALELLLQCINKVVRRSKSDFDMITTTTPDNAIEEINARILEDGFGYQFEGGEILQVDTLVLHKEAVVPALRLTARDGFESANAEYLKAHDSFRHGDYETSLTECAKAFESVLKIIGSKRGWEIQDTDTTSKLITAAVNAGFLEAYVSAGFTSLRALLESGVGPVRNKTAAHGAGTSKRNVPKELAAFQLHQTASVIVFLIESHVSQPIKSAP